MSKPRRAPLTDDERAERRRKEQELTEQAVALLRSSTGWQRWLRVRAQVGLRRYSFRNQLLIALQDPDATRLAGFRAWLALSYCVRRGETSHVRVWAPCPPSKRKIDAWRAAGANPDDLPRMFFRLEPVFTSAQVEPLPPPAQPAALDPPIAELEGDSLAWAIKPLEQLARELGYSVIYETLEPGHGGTCDWGSRFILISDAQSINAQVNAWCHELAHALVHDGREDGDPDLGYAEEELAAQSVAQIAVSFVGLDASEFTIGYLAAWSESAAPDTFEQIGQLVDRLARRLEETLISSDPGSETSDGGAEVAAV